MPSRIKVGGVRLGEDVSTETLRPFLRQLTRGGSSLWLSVDEIVTALGCDEYDLVAEIVGKRLRAVRTKHGYIIRAKELLNWFRTLYDDQSDRSVLESRSAQQPHKKSPVTRGSASSPTTRRAAHSSEEGDNMRQSRWTRSFASYSNDELLALSFRSVKAFNRCLRALWEDPELRGCPHDMTDGRALIVPREAVDILQRKPVFFESHEVGNHLALTRAALTSTRRQHGM